LNKPRYLLLISHIASIKWLNFVIQIFSIFIHRLISLLACLLDLPLSESHRIATAVQFLPPPGSATA
jgi:hypothetical protein